MRDVVKPSPNGLLLCGVMRNSAPFPLCSSNPYIDHTQRPLLVSGKQSPLVLGNNFQFQSQEAVLSFFWRIRPSNIGHECLSKVSNNCPCQRWGGVSSGVGELKGSCWCGPLLSLLKVVGMREWLARGAVLMRSRCASHLWVSLENFFFFINFFNSVRLDCASSRHPTDKHTVKLVNLNIRKYFGERILLNVYFFSTIKIIKFYPCNKLLWLFECMWMLCVSPLLKLQRTLSHTCQVI